MAQDQPAGFQQLGGTIEANSLGMVNKGEHHGVL